MCSSKNRRFHFLVLAIGLVGAAIGWSSPSEAYVNQIVIDATATVTGNPVPLGSSTPGASTSYTVYQGRIFGQINASDPHNAVITDIGLASTTGVVTYIANFQIVTPTNPAQRNGLMIHEVPNRGGNTVTINSSGVITTALVQGATYVQSGWQGDLLTQCPTMSPVPLYPCVSLSSPYGTLSSAGVFTPPTLPAAAANTPAVSTSLAAYVIQVPVATTDGNPPNGSNTITGSVYGHICFGTAQCGVTVGSTPTTAPMQIQAPANVPYLPAGYDPTIAPPYGLSTAVGNFWTLTSQSFTGVDSAKTTIPNTNWTWAYCPSGPPGTPNPYYICLSSGTFNPALLYEMVFTAQNPLVLGVGFAAFRDLASFLRYGTTAPGGGANPIAGTVTKAMTVGGSQSAAMIHGFIFWGFNQDESNRIVFDGAWPEVDGRMMVANIRWGQPNNLMDLYMGGDEAPVWWADYPNMARGLPANGMLHRCNATTPNTCPAILDTFGAAEIYTEKMPVALVGFTGVADIPQPSNVYRYYTAGATHGGGTVSFTWVPPTTAAPAGQLYQNSPIPETYSNNALLYAFIELLLNGTPMPPSIPGVTEPSLASGQLVLNTQAATGFPNIPGYPYGGNQAWPPFVYNFGPDENYDQETGVPTIQPPLIANIVPGSCPSGICPMYVSKVNADGNEVVGIPSVLGQAPLGTYAGWNFFTTGWYAPGVSNGPGGLGQIPPGAGNSGSFMPFWDSAAHRIAAGDPRPSLEERYGTLNGYNCVVNQATVQAVQQRFLLPSDQQTLIKLASASNVGTTYTPTSADVALAHNALCGLTATHDFNGDYKSDILWRDASGNVGMWLMNGSAVSKASVLGNVPGNWSIVGQRDFNGDGYADILWRDSVGDVGMWLMNGTSIISSTVLGNVPTTWSIAATGNFNGTGVGDILWRDTAGDVAIWLMNGTTVQQSAVIGNLSTNWAVAGADNHGDIFWRNTVTGEVGMWVMNGTTIAKSVDFGPMPLTWSVAGIGDFDGNGSEDILWRDTSGNVGIWLLNGTQVMSTAVLGNVPLNWSIAETGDYSGAGMSDILWLDNLGNVAAWFVNGTTVSSVTTYGNVGTTWSLQSQGAE